jgi:hypothetical protein
MDLYDPTNIAAQIAILRKDLRIDPSRPHCSKYYEAQALANLDRFIVIDENNPPMVSDDFMFAINLKEGSTPVKENPQRFNELQKKFLTAKTTLLSLTDKIEPLTKLQPDVWLSRLMLVLKAFQKLHGTNFMEAASKRENFADVATWFRMTMDLRLLNAATIPEPFPMPPPDMAKENCKDSRFFCISDLADAFF